jgi:DNA-binding FadR family transcriptional regulator
MQSHEAFIGGIEDYNFHYTIISASGNRIYTKLFEEIWNWGDAYFLWDNFERTSKELEEIRSIHSNILSAMKNRNQKELIKSLYEHFEITGKNIEMQNIEFSQSLLV